jgi:asparagine N-glycosylation enzyme membrane subunit Stt3
VLIGAGLAPHLNAERLAGTLLAFALAVGVAAHALDELRGRPLHTSIPSPVLGAAAAISLSAAAGIGLVGVAQIGWGLSAFILVGILLVVAYNLELWGGRLHNGVVFAAAWGAFPVLTAYYAQTRSLSVAAGLGAVFAYGLSHAQRVLSLEARHLRRHVVEVEGHRLLHDGSAEPLTRASLLQPVERVLVTLSWATGALGLALVAASAAR